MNEIERAIETIEGYIKAVEQRMRAGDVGVVVGYDAMLERRKGLVTALDICRAELTRQENAPLTWEELVSMTRKTVYIVDRTDDEKSGWAIVGKQYIKIGLEFVTLCENLAFRRELKELYGQTWLAYRYEPKGEPACTQD